MISVFLLVGVLFKAASSQFAFRATGSDYVIDYYQISESVTITVPYPAERWIQTSAVEGSTQWTYYSCGITVDSNQSQQLDAYNNYFINPNYTIIKTVATAINNDISYYDDLEDVNPSQIISSIVWNDPSFYESIYESHQSFLGNFTDIDLMLPMLGSYDCTLDRHYSRAQIDFDCAANENKGINATDAIESSLYMAVDLDWLDVSTGFIYSFADRCINYCYDNDDDEIWYHRWWYYYSIHRCDISQVYSEISEMGNISKSDDPYASHWCDDNTANVDTTWIVDTVSNDGYDSCKPAYQMTHGDSLLFNANNCIPYWDNISVSYVWSTCQWETHHCESGNHPSDIWLRAMGIAYVILVCGGTCCLSCVGWRWWMKDAKMRKQDAFNRGDTTSTIYLCCDCCCSV